MLEKEAQQDKIPKVDESEASEEKGETRQVDGGAEFGRTLTIERSGNTARREVDPEANDVLGLMGRLRPERGSAIEM